MTEVVGTIAAVRPSAAPVSPVALQPELSPFVIGRGEINKLYWTFRAGFDSPLAGIPLATWLKPEAQPGWKLVKSNGLREVWRAPLRGRVFYLKYYRTKGLAGLLRNWFRSSACEAEWNGGIFALRAGIAAVEPLAYANGIRRNGCVQSLLVTQAVEPAYPLNEHWTRLQSDDDARRRREDAQRLIDQLGELLARAHQAGFEHLDLHAANILIEPLGRRQYRPLFVDLHSARLGVAVSDRAVVRNLTQLNQWFRKNSSVGDRLRFLRAYCRWRNEYEQSFPHARPLGLEYDELVRALVEEAGRHAERLWAQRDRRVMRNGTYFTRLRLRGGWRGIAFKRCKNPQPESPCSRLTLDNSWWRERLGDPLKLFSAETHGARDAKSASSASRNPAADRPTANTAADGLCKNSHSALVARTTLGPPPETVPAIAKRPLSRNWRRMISQHLGISRSLRGWRMGNALLNRDIAVARPLAMLERRVGPLVLDNILLTELVAGAADLETDLRRQAAAHGVAGSSTPRPSSSRRDSAAWWRYKRDLCDSLVRHMRRTEERGFAHRDCKAGNILVVSGSQASRPPASSAGVFPTETAAKHDAPRVIWIDMDGMRRVRRVSSDQILAAITRLYVSLRDVPGLTRADYGRFLKAYFARFGADPHAWRGAWRSIADAAEKKQAQRERRRAWKLAHYGRE